MPHTPSAAKRLRQSLERRTRNRARQTELKTIRKQLLRALNDKNVDEAKEAYVRLTKRVDQAANLNVLHKNTAARLKARLAKKVHAAAKPA